MDKQLDVVAGIRQYWRWRWTILGTVVIAMVLTFVVVKQISPLYESHATLLPSNTNSRQKQLEEFTFGYEIHSERLVQLLGSSVILDSLNQAFQLAQHYEVDMTEKDGWDEYLQTCRDLIHIHKTSYGSVVVSVMDKDPEMASILANEISRLVNVINAEVLQSNGRVTLQAAEKEYLSHRQKSIQINDSIRTLTERNQSVKEALLRDKIQEKENLLAKLRQDLDQIRNQYHIYDYGKQVDILNKQLADARAVYLQESGALEILNTDTSLPDSMRTLAEARKTGAERRIAFFDQQLVDLSKVNARYNAALDQLAQERGLLAEARTDLDQLNKSLEPIFSSRSLQELERDYAWDQGQTRELQRSYQRAMANLLDPVPVAYVVEPARPSYKKVFPKTLLSMGLAGMGSFVFCLVVISFVDRLKGTPHS